MWGCCSVSCCRSVAVRPNCSSIAPRSVIAIYLHNVIALYAGVYFYFLCLSLSTLSLSRPLCVSLSHSSAKRLISASIDMPKTVELLDLSYNDITNIDADCFEVSRTICHIIKLYTKYRIKMVFFYGSLTKYF